MCDQRERLIGYVYDDCDAADRRAIDAHLAECQTCRDEIGGLRATRVDLLAWEIPAHQPIWRPIAPAPAPASPAWRQMPAWVLAAAASLVFVLGAAGGAATRVLWPSPAPAPGAPAAMAAAATSSDLAALKSNLLTQFRSEMEQRMVAVASHDSPRAVDASATVPRATVDALLARTAALERWQSKQISLNVVFDQKMARIGNRQNVSAQTDLNTQALRHISLEVGR